MLLGPARTAVKWQVPGNPDIQTRDMWFVCVELVDKVITQRKVLYQPRGRENMTESPHACLFGYCHEGQKGNVWR